MQLKELVKHLSVVRVEGPLDREFAGIAYDSRRVTPGMIFVAIPGSQTDGHDYITAAIDRGAAAIICERNGFASPRATKIKVSDARDALARAASVFYQNPSSKLQVIGVTGTNGKTTVAFMVKQILEAAGVKTGLLGTVSYEIG
ncbi:MAG TPA: Mur ligase domain-containing protein, partial [Candidatus Acidoferrum sp.]|nr:Mur ligase domain-containing protein [Candidatus Acidoferrum sp.]